MLFSDELMFITTVTIVDITKTAKTAIITMLIFFTIAPPYTL